MISVSDREKIERMEAETGIVRYGQIGSATLRCARARRMVAEWIATIEAAPERWLPEDMLAWLMRVRSMGR